MRIDLEKKQTEWQLLYQTAWETINQELARIDNSDMVPALDLDGNELPYLVDVNYWTQGFLDNLYQEVSSLGQRLLNESALPDTGVLLDWLNKELPAIHQQLENIILDARIKTINSQLRINVADLVVQALQQQGFTLDSSAYQENDLRAGYGAQLRNIEGNEVIVQVSSNGNSLGENELHIHSLDSEVKTEHELKKRWQEISQSLSSYGIEVGKYEQLPQHDRLPRSGIAYPHKRKKAILPIKTG